MMPIFVNQVEIGDTEIGQEMQYHPADSREEAWHMAAQSLVVRHLLLQQAADTGLCEQPDLISPGKQEEGAIDRLLQRDVKVPEADEATCRRFYEGHSERFREESSGRIIAFEQVHSHIRDYLHTKAMRIAVAEYIKALSCNASIKGIEL